MKIETRGRAIVEGENKLVHFDLVLVAENEDESQKIDCVGQPGTTGTFEIRLADGYGEHYVLLQPKHIKGLGWERDIHEITEEEALKLFDLLFKRKQ